jgi:hypothetical protein
MRQPRPSLFLGVSLPNGKFTSATAAFPQKSMSITIEKTWDKQFGTRFTFLFFQSLYFRQTLRRFVKKIALSLRRGQERVALPPLLQPSFGSTGQLHEPPVDWSHVLKSPEAIIDDLARM